MKNLILGGLAALLCAFAGPALASNCSPYPYTLSNGTTADANQVMANFNGILGCANSNLAHNGVNVDISQLTGLTTPLATSEGGTGTTTGNAPTATKWVAPITFALTGVVTGSSSVDGSGNVSMTTAFAPQAATFVNQQNQGVGSSGSGTTLETISSSNTYTQLNLNTAVGNTITGASVGSNLITIPAGTYEAVIAVPGQGGGGGYRCRLYDTTDAAALVVSPNMPGATSGGQQLSVTFGGFFTLAGTITASLQCMNSGVNNMSIGQVMNVSGQKELYETVSLLKVG